jgi:hypothetical protein
MSEPDPTGSPEEPPKPSPEGSPFSLPSWVDAGIMRSSDKKTSAERESRFHEEEAFAPHAPLAEPEGILEPERMPEPETSGAEESSVATAPKPAERGEVPARKGLALPWVLAALLFAGAAAVMAFMIWFRPAR